MDKVKNILAIRNDRLGEFLLCIPAFRALKESFPGAKLTLAVDPYLLELAKCIDGVDEVIPWEGKKLKFSELLDISRELKKRKFDLCVIFNPAREANLASFLGGVPKRVGYSRKWGFLLTHKMKDLKNLGQRHEVEYNLELAALAGARTQDKALLLKIADIRPDCGIVAIHPWTSDPVKQWPIENFRELAAKLAEEMGRKVVILGGKENMALAAKYFSGLGKNVIDLTGKTGLLELAKAIKSSGLLVSGDSGPVHLSCAVGTPVVALFRNDLPGKTAKRWGPWAGNSAVIEKNSLAGITVDEVLNKIKEMSV